MASYNKNEIRDIIIAVATLTVIFAFPTVSFVPIAFLAVVIAFLFHELAHRYIAKKFDAVAYFKLYPQGLLFGLLLLIFGFRAAAPGAVVVHPYRYSRWKYRVTHLTVNEWGWIAAVGPIINILFAILFAGIAFYFPVISFGAKYIFLVNAVLATFNLIPFGPLDGAKVMKWKPWFWAFLFLISAVLVLFAYS
jgi:Zn-dependent protease